MDAAATRNELHAVPADATLRFRPGRRGLELRSDGGTFLVTQEGDPVDHVLEPEDRYCTRRRGLVVVWALRAGRLAAERRACDS